MTPLIFIDSRENGAEYIHYLEGSERVQVTLKTLDSCDIFVNGLAIERKTIDDFILTLKENRLFEQLYRLKRLYKRQLLLIEGSGMRYHLDQEPFLGLYIRLSAGWQLPVLHTQNAEQTASSILRICYQDAVAPPGPMRSRPRNFLYQKTSIPMNVLMQIPGIGAKHALALLTYFKTLDRIFCAEQKELRKVPGIGGRRAAAIALANKTGAIISSHSSGSRSHHP